MSDSKDPTNRDRAARGALVVDAYMDTNGADTVTTTVIDILSDLMHYCDTPEAETSFAEALRMAQLNYEAERMEG